MPYDNKLNRRLAEQLRQNNLKYIQNTHATYDTPISNVGNANKELVDDDNLQQNKEHLMDLEEELPENVENVRKKRSKDNDKSAESETDKESLEGRALGSKGGFARGTIRDTGEGIATLGAGKKKKKVNDNVKDLLLKRTCEGGKKKDSLPNKGDIGEFKKRGRPNKMIDNVLLGSGTRQIGGKKGLLVSSEMKGSTMSGFGKKTSRIDLVKEIMKERGVSMIEASKLIKKEGLYKKE